MNKFILASATLSAFTLALHFFGGGPQYLVPAMLSDMTIDQKVIYSVIWHTITALLAINAIALFFAARSDRPAPIVLLISAQNLAMAALFAFFGLSRMGTMLVQPQWIFFIAIAAPALWGLRKPRSLVAE